MEATARDAMTTVVFTLYEDTPLDEAATALSARGISGAPVCDLDGRIVGVVSKGDLAEWSVGPHAFAGATVADVMSTDVIKASPDQSLHAIARQMVFEGIHRVVVVDENGAVVGIVAPLDALRVLLGEVDLDRTRGARFPAWPLDARDRK